MTASTLFLIVGAGGRVGATGNHAARQLMEMGLPVRAFVRQANERADELRALGAEIAVGDLRNFQVVRAALDGVQRAYFTYPIAEGLLEATAIFAAAGKEAGLESMVNMSQLPAGSNHASPASRQHWLAERVLDWSGIGVTHLRPSYFLENLIFFAAPTIQAEGKIYLPYGQGRHAPVAGEDLARASRSAS
jgi:NAD(P)H dehydrogenase (quinone)